MLSLFSKHLSDLKFRVTEKEKEKQRKILTLASSFPKW